MKCHRFCADLSVDCLKDTDTRIPDFISRNAHIQKLFIYCYDGNKIYAQFNHMIQPYNSSNRKQPYRINGITKYQQSKDTTLHTSRTTLFSPSRPYVQRYQTNISFMYVHYGNIGWLLFLYVYLKVFPPFFIQVVSILEELSKYKDTNQMHDKTDLNKGKFMT